jgi:hypothetical protein
MAESFYGETRTDFEAQFALRNKNEIRMQIRANASLFPSISVIPSLRGISNFSPEGFQRFLTSFGMTVI